MKGYCPICRNILDDVEFTQFKMCVKCYLKKGKKDEFSLP